MKSFFAIASTLFLFAHQPAPLPATEYHVYLLAGQSNMDGRGLTADLPAEQQQPVDQCIIFYRNALASSETWKPLSPGFSVPPRFKDRLPSPKFGPEIGFARTMRARFPGQALALIKGSKGGTSLRADWNPGVRGKPETQGRQYRDLIETIRLATEQLEQQGHSFQVRGLLWHQGESDAKQTRQTYRTQLTTFVARIREDVGIADLPIVTGEVFDNGKRDSVRTATQEVAAADSTVGFVSAKDTTTWDSGTHFDARSQLLLGERYARQMQLLLAPE
ncbi:MAG: sialate O-acetylesterase [Planctomycetaceae bacterium]|nr:sialate O-acetylesterase [Planctomycetaceae bacterium]